MSLKKKIKKAAKKVAKVFSKPARLAALASIGGLAMLKKKQIKSFFGGSQAAGDVASSSGIPQRIVGMRQIGEGAIGNVSGTKEEGVV